MTTDTKFCFGLEELVLKERCEEQRGNSSLPVLCDSWSCLGPFLSLAFYDPDHIPCHTFFSPLL